MDKSALVALGLTEKESDLYWILYQKHSAPAGQLIKDTGMHRAAVYDILKRLTDKGLVGFVNSGKKREFTILPLSLAKHRLEEEIETIRKKQFALTELEKKPRGNMTEEPNVAVLKGKRGLQIILYDLLENAPNEWHVFGAQGEFKRTFPEFYQLFHAKRTRQNIVVKIIYNSNVKLEKREKELKLLKTRYVDKRFDTPATTYIYGDKVVIIVWSNPVYIMWIKSKEVARSYENQFQMLWKNAKA